MENKNRMVIPLSTVKDMLEAEGWSFYRTFNNEYIFRDEEESVLAVPQNPHRPRLIFLDELLDRTQILRKEFIKVARPEWNMTGNEAATDTMQFELELDPGEAEAVDLTMLFTALSDLNRAGGGIGLRFEPTEEGE